MSVHHPYLTPGIEVFTALFILSQYAKSNRMSYSLTKATYPYHRDASDTSDSEHVHLYFAKNNKTIGKIENEKCENLCDADLTGHISRITLFLS
jgi:hypothetical protein